MDLYLIFGFWYICHRVYGLWFRVRVWVKVKVRGFLGLEV